MSCGLIQHSYRLAVQCLPVKRGSYPVALMEKAAPQPTQTGRVALSFTFAPPPPVEQWSQSRVSSIDLYQMRLLGERISLQEGFNELLCLDSLTGVATFWYQIETVKRVLKHFRGRMLLADEVGLGKTIEACLLLKEYLLRGLVERVLILTPPSLVSQWREELDRKFALTFVTTESGTYRSDPQQFWRETPRLIASLNVAKAAGHAEIPQDITYDLVIVDEAHHLKNRATRNYQLVNGLKSKFIFLLSATPVQNDIMELYQLVTLLRPGTFTTPAAFRRQFLTKGDAFSIRNRERLRALLGEVMIRNTRSLADVRLPRRHATTLIVQPEEAEHTLYQAISALVKEQYGEEKGLDRFTANTLLMEAGSSPAAVKTTVDRLLACRKLTEKTERALRHCAALADRLPPSRKAQKLKEIRARLQKKGLSGTTEAEKEEAKAAAAERELQSKIHDLEEKYAVRVQVSFVNVLYVTLPVLLARMSYQRRQAFRELSFFWNPLLKDWEPLACEGCRENTFAFSLCDDKQHLTCADCSHPCPTCERRFCSACQRQGCRGCRKASLKPV